MPTVTYSETEYEDLKLEMEGWRSDARETNRASTQLAAQLQAQRRDNERLTSLVQRLKQTVEAQERNVRKAQGLADAAGAERERMAQRYEDVRTRNAGLIDDLLHTQEVYQELVNRTNSFMFVIDGFGVTDRTGTTPFTELFTYRKLKKVLEGGPHDVRQGTGESEGTATAGGRSIVVA